MLRLRERNTWESAYAFARYKLDYPNGDDISWSYGLHWVNDQPPPNHYKYILPARLEFDRLYWPRALSFYQEQSNLKEPGDWDTFADAMYRHGYRDVWFGFDNYLVDRQVHGYRVAQDAIDAYDLGRKDGEGDRVAALEWWQAWHDKTVKMATKRFKKRSRC
jgi:hypothetical protein